MEPGLDPGLDPGLAPGVSDPGANRSRVLARGADAPGAPGADEPRGGTAAPADAGGDRAGWEPGAARLHAPRGRRATAHRDRAVAGAGRRRVARGRAAAALRRPGPAGAARRGRPAPAPPPGLCPPAASAWRRGVPRARDRARAPRAVATTRW